MANHMCPKATIGCIYVDIMKAFDKVPRNFLFNTPQSVGINNSLL